MKWLFRNQESKERRREEEEQIRKQEEATRMLADLFIRHNSMTTVDIIGELERIHRFCAVPSWAPAGERGGYFYQIAKELSHGSLSSEETGRLVAMLLWPELRGYKDRSAPSCLVLAAVQNPSEAYIPILSEHVAWLEKEVKPLGSTQYQTEIASEIRLAKGAIQACRLRP
ncbi:MAG TPA: hypothetical protein VEJ45_07860 [Candidatus Acidoferrales bacterium]|nr:hypothetical protein [Candidatus Acidoferrales bacterium]